MVQTHSSAKNHLLTLGGQFAAARGGQFNRPVQNGIDHDKLGNGQAGTFNKAVEEITVALTSMSISSYSMGNVAVIRTAAHVDGKPVVTITGYGKVRDETEYTMSQQFKTYVNRDIETHKPGYISPVGGAVTTTGETTFEPTEFKQVLKGSRGKQYEKPPVVQLTNPD